MTAEMHSLRNPPDTDTTHSEGALSPPGHSCRSRRRRCPLLPAFLEWFSLPRACAQQLRGRARLLPSCQLHAGHRVIGVSDLVILFLLLLTFHMMPSLLLRVGIPLNVIINTLAAVCVWLKVVALRRIAHDCPDSGSDRKMTGSEWMLNKDEQIMKVEREVQTCDCRLPLVNEFDECLATSQQTDSRALSDAAMHHLNNDDDPDERRIEHLNIHIFESSEDPSVQQPPPQASSTDLQISSAANEMPEHDVNVAQEEYLPVDHDRKLPSNRQNSTDIQIQNITAAFEKSLKTVKTYKTKQLKRICSRLVQKTRISQLRQKNSEHEKKEEAQTLEQMLTRLEESDGKGAAKSDVKKHLTALRFIPQTQEQVYTCTGPQNGLHHEMWTEESRLASFSLHPAVPSFGVWVTQLAAAGFFCPDRNSSQVRCAFCSVEADINNFSRRPPLEVHLILSPSCPLVKGEAPNRSLEEQTQRVGRQYTEVFFGSGASVAPAAIAQSHQQVKEASGSGSRKEFQGAAVQFGDHASPQLISSGQPPERSFQSQPRHDSASATTFVSHPPGGEEPSQYSGFSQQSCSLPHAATGLQPPDFLSVPLTPTPLPSAGTEQRSTAHEHVPAAQPAHQMSQAPDQTPSAEPSTNGGTQNSHLSLPQDASHSRTEGNRETIATFQTAQLDERHEEGSHSSHASPNTDTTAAAAAAHSSQSSTTNESERQVVTYTQLGIYTQEPKRPDFAIANARVGTYANWPHSATHSPEDMAQAGFYFVGVEDLVRCFYCKGGLKSWSRSLRPWVEHARFYPLCPFVGQVKGQEFIEVVQQLNEDQEEISDAKVEEELKRRQLAASERGMTYAGTGATEKGEEEMGQSHLGTGGGRAEDGARAKTFRPGAEGDDAEVDEAHMEKSADELEYENLEITHERLCKICQVEEVSILFLPCGHLVSCSQCAPALRTCAVCRQRVKGRVRVMDDKTSKHPDDNQQIPS